MLARFGENNLAHLAAEGHVEAREGLVKDQGFGAGKKCPHQRHARRLTAGKRRRVAIGKTSSPTSASASSTAARRGASAHGPTQADQ